MTERRWTEPEDRKPLTRKQFAALFMRQDGRCGNCGQRLEIKGGRLVCIDEHLNPLWRGGSNGLENRELWCVPCTKPKTAAESTARTKGLRVRDKHIGAMNVDKRERGWGNRSGRLKKKLNGDIIDKFTGEIIRRGR
jgi:5-methylcytosine-specific restriction endonuclease McrA